MNIETTAEPIREGLPSLPKCKMLSGMDMESLHVLYTAGQMQDYARAALAARAAAPVSARAAPDQPAVVVPAMNSAPDRIEGEPEESFYRRIVYANGWNACRAAMLAASPTPSKD